jgi:flagellar motor switch protein FliN
MSRYEPQSDGSDSDGLAWLLSEWAGALTSAIAGMNSQAGRAVPSESGKQPDGSRSFWWAQQFSFSPQPSVWIGAEESCWNQIGSQALKAIGVDAPELSDIQDTYREIVTQSLSGLASCLTQCFGEEITCLDGEHLALPPTLGETGYVSLTMENGEAQQLCFAAGDELLRRLGLARAQTSAAARERAEISDVPSSVPAFESMLDVEMPVTVSLGKTRLCLEEALALRNGSIVRMSCGASDPVDLELNGAMVARGEIVCIRGQYAIRILELTTRSERMRRLNCMTWPQTMNGVTA